MSESSASKRPRNIVPEAVLQPRPPAPAFAVAAASNAVAQPAVTRVSVESVRTRLAELEQEARATHSNGLLAGMSQRINWESFDRGTMLARRLHRLEAEYTAIDPDSPSLSSIRLAVPRSRVHVIRFEDKDLPPLLDEFQRAGGDGCQQASAEVILHLVLHSLFLVYTNGFRESCKKGLVPPNSPKPFRVFLEAELAGESAPREPLVRHTSERGFLSSAYARTARITGYRLWIFEVVSGFPVCDVMANLVDANESLMSRVAGSDPSRVIGEINRALEKEKPLHLPADVHSAVRPGGGQARGATASTFSSGSGASSSSGMTTVSAMLATASRTNERWRLCKSDVDFATLVETLHRTPRYFEALRRTRSGCGALREAIHPACPAIVFAPHAMFERLRERATRGELSKRQCSEEAYCQVSPQGDVWRFPRPDCAIELLSECWDVANFCIRMRPDVQCTLFSSQSGALSRPSDNVMRSMEFADASALELRHQLHCGVASRPILSLHGIRQMTQAALSELEQNLFTLSRRQEQALASAASTGSELASRYALRRQLLARKTLDYVQTTALRLYMENCAHSSSRHLSVPGRLLLQWFEARPSKCVSCPLNVLDAQLSLFANSVASTFYSLSKLLMLINHHDLGFLMVASAFDAYRYAVTEPDGMHINVCLEGRAATTKSFLLNLLQMLFVEGTVSEITSMSVRAATSSDDRNDRIEIYHEAPPGMMSGDARKGGDMMQESIMKERMTRGKVSVDVLTLLPNGHRVTLTHTCESHGVVQCATNNVGQASEAMRSRMHSVNMNSRNASSVAKRAATTPVSHLVGVEKRWDTAMTATNVRFQETIRTRQFLVYHVEKLLMLCVLREPSLACFDILVQQITTHLADRFLTTIDARTTARMRFLLRTLVIQTALHYLYDVPDVSPYYGQPFVVSQLLDLAPLLHDTEEMVFFVFELMRDAFVQPSVGKLMRAMCMEYFVNQTIDQTLATRDLLKSAFPRSFGNAKTKSDTPYMESAPDKVDDYTRAAEYVFIKGSINHIAKTLSEKHATGVSVEEMTRLLKELESGKRVLSKPYRRVEKQTKLMTTTPSGDEDQQKFVFAVQSDPSRNERLVDAFKMVYVETAQKNAQDKIAATGLAINQQQRGHPMRGLFGMGGDAQMRAALQNVQDRGIAGEDDSRSSIVEPMRSLNASSTAAAELDTTLNRAESRATAGSTTTTTTTGAPSHGPSLMERQGFLLVHVSLLDYTKDVLGEAIDACRHKHGRATPYRRLRGVPLSERFPYLLRTKEHAPNKDVQLHTTLYGTLVGVANEMLNQTATTTTATPPSQDGADKMHQLLHRHALRNKTFGNFDRTSYEQTRPASSSSSSSSSSAATALRLVDLDLDEYASCQRLTALHWAPTNELVDEYTFHKRDAAARLALLMRMTGRNDERTLEHAFSTLPGNYPVYLQTREEDERAQLLQASTAESATQQRATHPDAMLGAAAPRYANRDVEMASLNESDGLVSANDNDDDDDDNFQMPAPAVAGLNVNEYEQTRGRLMEENRQQQRLAAAAAPSPVAQKRPAPDMAQGNEDQEFLSELNR